MIRKISLAALAIAFAVLCTVAVTPAMAGVVTVTTTLDVNDIQAGSFTGGVQGAPPFSPFSVDLSAGDTFDYTIDFLPGQELTINNLSMIWAFSYADSSTDVVGTGALSLLGPTGAPLYTSNTKTDTEGEVHFGQQFNGSDFPGLPASVTFAGLHYVGTVDQYVDPTVTVRTYNDPALYFNADSFSTGVPEPSSMLLLGTGLLVFGGTFKRKFFSARNRNL
jgi:hypothetical protein